jgi:serine protease Do
MSLRTLTLALAALLAAPASGAAVEPGSPTPQDPRQPPSAVAVSGPSAPQGLQARIAEERRSVIVEAVQRVAPSVAAVVISGRRRVPIFDDPFMREFFGYRLGPSRESYYEMQSGSAVMISERGEFLTNQHVVGGADAISLLLPNGEVRPARVVGISMELDLALLEVEPDGMRPATLGTSRDLQVGEWLVAVGYPVGGSGITTESRFRPTVTVGVVSALERSFTPSRPRVAQLQQFYPDMIQTDAAINPGNSGGPLANAAGDVVGINTFILTESGGSQGLGFAIPIDRALRAADELRTYGYVRRIDLSEIQVRSAGMTDAEAARAGLGAGPRGLIIADPGIAAASGLRVNDVLLDVDSEPVNSFEEAQLALIPRFVGDHVVLGVWRDGRRIELELVLREAPRRR